MKRSELAELLQKIQVILHVIALRSVPNSSHFDLSNLSIFSLKLQAKTLLAYGQAYYQQHLLVCALDKISFLFTSLIASDEEPDDSWMQSLLQEIEIFLANMRRLIEGMEISVDDQRELDPGEHDVFFIDAALKRVVGELRQQLLMDKIIDLQLRLANQQKLKHPSIVAQDFIRCIEQCMRLLKEHKGSSIKTFYYSRG